MSDYLKVWIDEWIILFFLLLSFLAFNHRIYIRSVVAYSLFDDFEKIVHV